MKDKKKKHKSNEEVPSSNFLQVPEREEIKTDKQDDEVKSKSR